MKPTKRLSKSERRAAILKAAGPVFAKFGIDRTTTKQLARAAKVSEALLYEHFSSKNELYAELTRYGSQSVNAAAGILATLAPGSQTLIVAFSILVYTNFLHLGDHGKDGELGQRLLIENLTKDGKYAKAYLDSNFVGFFPILDQSVQVAESAGELESLPGAMTASYWFVFQLSLCLALFAMARTPVSDCNLSQEEVADQAILFLLRGFGFKADVVQKYFHPHILKSLLREKINT